MGAAISTTKPASSDPGTITTGWKDNGDTPRAVTAQWSG
jgi:hypothetical protein